MASLSRLSMLGARVGALWHMSTSIWAVAASPTKGSYFRDVGPDSASKTFPHPDDPFHFMPCVLEETIRGIPLLNDTNPTNTWSKLFNPDSAKWFWGSALENTSSCDGSNCTNSYEGRGLYMCGYMDVPMDYLNESDTRIMRLAVTKYQVSGLMGKSPRTIMFNPGGPGIGGASHVLMGGEGLSQGLSNGSYDVFGWDPRGVGRSQPAVNCYPYWELRDRWSLARDKDLKESPDARRQLELVDALHEAVFQACHRRLGDVPRFVSTASGARDMESFRVALGEPETTAYLASYGTILGQVYGGMFPEAAGRIVLDAMLSARSQRAWGDYAHSFLHSTADTWNIGFLGECIAAGPQHCALAKPINGSEVTLDGLKARMHGLLNKLVDRPVPGYTENDGPVMITYGSLTSLIGNTLNYPSEWPDLAQGLADLEAGDPAWLAGRVSEELWYHQPSVVYSPEDAPHEEAYYAVVCGDRSDLVPPAGGLGFWESLWHSLTAKSLHRGLQALQTEFPCLNYAKYWPQGAEVYRGDLNKTLRFPMLLVSKTYDPSTPLANGRQLQQEMGINARSIVHHGYGHTLDSDPSNCTNAHVLRYLLNGTVPASEETDCYANEKPYRYKSSALEAEDGSGR